MTNDVSVIITSCNYGNLIARAIRSVRNQIVCTPEIVIVDDASTDNTEQEIKPFLTTQEMDMQITREMDMQIGAYRYLQYIRNPKNVGVAESANIGIRASTRQYFVRLDADDYISSETCFMLRTFLAQNLDHIAVSCDYYLVEGGCGDEQKLTRKCALEDPIACGVMYRRDPFLQFGGYERGRRYKEVEELHKRFGDKFKIGHIHIPFYRYEMHKFNKTKEQAYKDATT